MPRMLVCKSCKTVDVMPLFESDVSDPHERAKLDTNLTEAIERHLATFGGNPEQHPAVVIAVADDEYELVNAQKLRQAIFDDTLEEYLRGERDQLKADALECYNDHGRPTYGIGYGIGCPDYMSEKKIIGPKKKGVPKEEQMYLCHFCPVHSYVEHYKNKGRFG